MAPGVITLSPRKWTVQSKSEHLASHARPAAAAAEKARLVAENPRSVETHGKGRDAASVLTPVDDEPSRIRSELAVASWTHRLAASLQKIPAAELPLRSPAPTEAMPAVCDESTIASGGQGLDRRPGRHIDWWWDSNGLDPPQEQGTIDRWV